MAPEARRTTAPETSTLRGDGKPALRRQKLAVLATVAAALLAVALLWWRTFGDADTRSGRDVVMTAVGRTTCVPVHDTQKIVYGEAMTNVSDEPVEIISAHFNSTGGARLNSTWLAEPEHTVGVLNFWPPGDMARDFESGQIKRAPAQLRPKPDRAGEEGQSLVLFIRMPAGSTISNVSVSYRKSGSDTVYRSNATTSTLRAVGAKAC